MKKRGTPLASTSRNLLLTFACGERKIELISKVSAAMLRLGTVDWYVWCSDSGTYCG